MTSDFGLKNDNVSRTPSPCTQVGDIVEFGQYPQGVGGEVQPLEWRVLEVQDGVALLLTDKLIDYVPYNVDYLVVTWETCTLRRWMNDVFISKAFNSSEQSRLVVSNNSNPDNPAYRTKGGNDTQDRVFALSIPEAQRYFASVSARTAYTTDYAHTKGYDCKDRSDYWWLRSPGYFTYDAASITTDGCVSSIGSDVKLRNIAVRLACRIHLSDQGT